MAAFPAYALLQFEGFDERPQDAVLRTNMESGPAKQAVLQSRVMIQRQVSYILLSNADYQSFKTFVRTTLHMGVDWFDWTDPSDTLVKQGRIVNGYSGITFQPRRKNLSRWTATFQLETWG
jgi:hypothetical protein